MPEQAKTIHELWESYRFQCISKDTSDIDVRIMKNVFYSGCFALANIIDDINKLPKNESKKYMSDISEEIMTWIKSIEKAEMKQSH